MSLTPQIVLQRQQKMAETLKEAELSGLALNPGPSLTYLTGLHFHLMERPVIGLFSPEGPPQLVLPELESAKLAGLGYPLEAATYGEDPATWPEVFAKGFSRSKGAAVIGVEDGALRLLEYRILQAVLPGADFPDASDVTASLRMNKDAQEKAAMQKAAEVVEAALTETLAHIRVGMSELEVANRLLQEVLNAGSLGELPFQPIVSTGPNGANPHATPSSRPLAEGDLLVIDFGANVEGYFSDITRTFAVGSYSVEQKRVYDTVLAANQAGRETAAPGTACQDVDRAARAVIEQTGYGEFFIHRTGHGLGMEAHEPPYIREGNTRLLEPGMSFTIEPGIYIPEQYGVRIEDDVIITADGLHSFTTFPRELQIIGG